MKYLFILILTLLSFCSSKVEKKESINYEKYINSSISVFLQENRGYSSIRIESKKPGVASSLSVYYPSDSLTVELFPSKFEHMKTYDSNGIWNIEEIKKEKISIIRVSKNDIVINVIPYKKNFFNNID